MWSRHNTQPLPSAVLLSLSAVQASTANSSWELCKWFKECLLRRRKKNRPWLLSPWPGVFTWLLNNTRIYIEVRWRCWCSNHFASTTKILSDLSETRATAGWSWCNYAKNVLPVSRYGKAYNLIHVQQFTHLPECLSGLLFELTSSETSRKSLDNTTWWRLLYFIHLV